MNCHFYGVGGVLMLWLISVTVLMSTSLEIFSYLLYVFLINHIFTFIFLKNLFI